MMINRALFNILRKTSKSILLLGPRQTGKSTLIKELAPHLSINLANEATYLDFSRNPEELEERIKRLAKGQTVFIDEIQRLPSLMNTAQDVIDNDSRKLKFYLTGSSARKLKRGNANLLPGRVHAFRLGGLCAQELGYQMDTESLLETGSLPGIYTDEDINSRKKTLLSYSGTYLKEEIQSEALTKNIEGFSRFLYLVAIESGNFLNLSKLASDARIPRQTAVRYFEIMEDTLIIQRVDAYSPHNRSRFIKHPKYFFFDVGVLNALLGNFQASDDRKGRLFENLFLNQLVNSAHAIDCPIKIMSFRTEGGVEVDFIVEMKNSIYAIEVKASKNISRKDLGGLKHLKEQSKAKMIPLVAYLGNQEKEIDEIPILPWQKVLKEIGL